MKIRLILCALLAAAVLGSAGITASQDAPPASPGMTRQFLAVSFLRNINTIELSYKFGHGTYATWDQLLNAEKNIRASMKNIQSDLAKIDPRIAGETFAPAPGILPGWNLRLNLVNGGAGYQLQLEDLTDKYCSFSAFTDDRGIIWQGKAIDCKL